LSLPAEHPSAGLARDEALLDQALPAEHRSAGLAREEALLGEALLEDGRPGPVLTRWWVPASPAVVVGLGLWHRVADVVDLERCRLAGVPVLARRAGGGALLLDEHMLCGAVCVPLPNAHVSHDLTESYRWLGDCVVELLRAAGVVDARRVEVSEARSDVAALRGRGDATADALLASCFGALSPHEVVVRTSGGGSAKIVGLAQVRRRHAALFQIGILLRDQARLADYLKLPDDAARTAVEQELARRTIGVEAFTGQSASAVAAAIADATPCVP
jgi:lipoate-protein ligase A